MKKRNNGEGGEPKFKVTEITQEKDMLVVAGALDDDGSLAFFRRKEIYDKFVEEIRNPVTRVFLVKWKGRDTIPDGVIIPPGEKSDHNYLIGRLLYGIVISKGGRRIGSHCWLEQNGGKGRNEQSVLICFEEPLKLIKP